MAAHTPGPWAWEWTAEKSNEWAVGQAWDKDGKPLSGQLPQGEWLEGRIIERRLIGFNESGHARAADARLIAAAPELLAALKDIVEDLEARWDMRDPRTNPGIRDNVERSKAIIVKAEGSVSQG